MRASGIVNTTPDKFAELIFKIDRRGEFDDMFKKGEIIEKIDDNLNIVYSLFDSGSMVVSNRDFVTFVGKVHEGDNVYIASKSIPHEKYPEKSNPVRGDVIASGWILKKIGENKTSIIFINGSDPKG